MENKSSKSPILIINKLELVGVRKNYTILFNSGLNIIHGDSDTGKSSILDLIDYCLGGYEVDLYDEIISSGKYCLLEVSLNSKTYTIKRDIFESNSFIEVYHSSIDDMNSVFPLEYGPNFSKKGEEGYISDFFLDALSIPKVEIKQSPTKPDSKMVRLSFRDILKFNYINQDDVGSKDLLDRKNPIVAIKNQETFKFLHNLLDTNIAQLNALISEKTTQRNALNLKYKTISAFFRETQLRTKDELEVEKSNLKDQVENLNREITLLDKQMISNTSGHNELREIIYNLDSQINVKNREIENLHLQIKQNILLKNDYLQDIEKLNTSIKMSKHVPIDKHEVECPVCSNSLKLQVLKSSFQESNSDVLEDEVRSLNRRFKDLGNLIDENRNDILLAQAEIQNLVMEVDRARILLDNNTKEIISPFLSQRDGHLTTRTKMIETIDKIDYTLKLRNQVNEIVKSSAKLDIEIAKLMENLNELLASTPTVQTVTHKIADLLQEFLIVVQMNNVRSVAINDRTFTPQVRDMEYYQLTSGGVRTLVSVGYFVSILKNGLSETTNHPNFLMIDTLGKYLGKTKSQYLSETSVSEDAKEGIRADDPTKYINMYKYLLSLCQDRDDVQIIVVDNDIPSVIETSLKSSIVKEYNVIGANGLPRGFIDDAHLK